ncbi:MAG: F0F1 ATP synthase subunit beta, partial [Candidatus Omnitrophota bacterium]
MLNESEEVRGTGKVIAVQGPVVDVRFLSVAETPSVYGMLLVRTIDDREIYLEVAEHRPGHVARCIAINSTQNLQRNAKAVSIGNSIQIPTGDVMYARMVNVLGQPIDQKGPIEQKNMRPIRRLNLETTIPEQAIVKSKYEVLETGIKMIDLLFPLVKGTKTGVLGG